MTQYVNFNTREDRKLDLCYSNIKDAFKSYKLPPLRNSDHLAIQLVPIYKARCKKTKKKKIKIQQLDDEATDKCKACFDTTNWESMFSDDINQTIDAVSNYITFVTASNACEKEIYINNNQRPWINKDIKCLMSKKREMYKNNDAKQAKVIQGDIDKQIAAAKSAYKEKMLAKMSSDMKSAWKGIKSMAGLNDDSSSTTFSYLSADGKSRLANDLNEFYVRFDDPLLRSDVTTHFSASDDFSFEEIPVDEVCKQFLRCKVGKSSGPDHVSTNILKVFAYQLAPVFTTIFNFCIRKGVLPDVWKLASIVPLPKKPNPKANNDYRPVALTSVVMKCFEKILKSRLSSFVKLNENQFAYRKGRSTKDACLTLDHYIRSHLEKPGTYARVLFIDYSSAFNTIVPSILLDKLSTFNVPNYLKRMVAAFLHNRKQYVNIDNRQSNVISCDIGCPQGCVLSPFLFSIYTDFLQSEHDNVKLLKYADDMALIGLLDFKSKNDPNDYFDAVDSFVSKCKAANLIINADKTKEMIVSFSRTHSVCDYVFIDGKLIDKVDDFKYLGTFFGANLKWSSNTDHIYKKLKQRFFAFSKFKHFKPNEQQRNHFIRSLIFPILTYNIELWYNSANQFERDKLLKPFDRNNFDTDINFLVEHKIFTTATNILVDNEHILNGCYEVHRKLYQLPRIRTTRFLASFIPQSINVLNGNDMRARKL